MYLYTPVTRFVLANSSWITRRGSFACTRYRGEKCSPLDLI